MDKQTYLNQISATNRSTQKSSNFLSSPLSKILVISVVALLVIIIFGSILGNANNGTKNDIIALKIHTENVTSVVNDYQPLVKSSRLRSTSASLHSIISSTTSALNNYLTEKYDLKEKNIDKNLITKEDSLKEELSTDLAEAKINGLLDHVYARQMAYETSVIMNRELQIYQHIKDDALKTALQNSYNSLETLYHDFESFSESK